MNDFEYIYKMDWYEKPNSRKSVVTMYYLNEKDTRYGHEWPIGFNGTHHCTITVVKVKKYSDEHHAAINNSENNKKKNG